MMTIMRSGRLQIFIRNYSTAVKTKKYPDELQIVDKKFITDDWTNVPNKIINTIGKNLHTKKYHPLSHMRERLVNYYYKAFKNKAGNPEFSVYDNLSPVVSVQQNFDSLLIPKRHSSRSKNDCYYINQDTLLRAHATAHQSELISMGLNNFLIVGDVYRRDEIDATHYPIFHQVDGVRLCTAEETFRKSKDAANLKIFEDRDDETDDKQAVHTLEAVKLMEYELKTTLVYLSRSLFGTELRHRWVPQFFPFTHPSWELEVFYNNTWMEVLGCGIIRHEILTNAGVHDRIGWAFGLGLERLAMTVYDIPDIRLFWSEDSGFLNQFKFDDPCTPVKYTPISVYPQLSNDISFWLPEGKNYTVKDFYDLVREIGGDSVEQIYLVDEYFNIKTERTSHCYRIIYRHMERTLTQKEVTVIHNKIAEAVQKDLSATMRNK